MTIKPHLYLFDPDQTHDLLWVDKIDSRFCTLITNAFQRHSLFDGGNPPISLIERYIINSDYIPWAEEWTTIYYQFLKTLSRTFLLNNKELTGESYGFTPQYKATLPPSLSLGASWPQELTIKVNKGSLGIVSWLESAHKEISSGQYCSQVSETIQVWQRNYKIIDAINSEDDIFVNLNCNFWLHNSVVLQNASIENLNNAGKRLLLYSELSSVLGSCMSQFNLTPCLLLTDCSVTVTTTWTRQFGVHVEGTYRYDDRLEFTSPVFQAVADSFCYTALIYAIPPKRNDIKYLSSEQEREDLGNIPSLAAKIRDGQISFNFETDYINYFIEWKNNTELPWGYEPDNLGSTIQAAIDLPLIFPNINHAQYRLKTFVNDDKLTNNWNYGVTGAYKNGATPAYPPLYPNQENSGNNYTWQIRKPNGDYLDKRLHRFSIYLITNPNNPIYFYFYRNDYPAFAGSPSSNLRGLAPDYSNISAQIITSDFLAEPPITNDVTYRIYQFWFAFNSQRDVAIARLQNHIGYNVIRHLNQIKIREIGASILFSDGGVPELINSGTTVFFQNDLLFFRNRYTKLNCPVGNCPEANVIDDNEDWVYERKLRLRFNVNYDSGNFNYSDIHNITQIYYGLSSPYGGRYPDPSPIPDPIIIAQTFSLNRTLRTQTPSWAKYVLYQYNNATGKFIKSYPSEEQFLLLIEPSPGLFTCDPDPDPLQNRNTDPQPNNPNNTEWIGDIMPDSLRVKEIHAALNAQKFAYKDNSTTESRIANLGYYIERLARIVGISVNSDGTVRSVRQRKVLIPDSEGNVTIPAGWGRGQWQINNGGSEEGQEGGNPEEERDGIVYANRSNRNVPSEFNEEAFNLEPPTFVLCENLMQYIESYLEDLDAGLNWQEMGAMAIPASFTNDDGTRKFCTYEGMGSLLAEVAYMLSSISTDTSQTLVSSVVTQAVVKTILEAFGVPLDVSTIALTSEGDGEFYNSRIPYPTLAVDSPTVIQLLMNVIENQSRILASNAKVRKQ